MPSYSAPIVGMFYRPPAAAIMKCLHSGCQLSLRAEPSNAFDPNAVQVLLSPSHIKAEAHPKLAEALSGMGYSVPDILEREEWHLGYLAKEYAAALQPLLGDAKRVECGLGFGPNGKPLALMTIE